LKGLPFIGNLCIAVLSAIVPIIYLSIQKGLYTDCQDSIGHIKSIELTLIFVLLAFFSTLARELVKDIEDVNGDKIHNLKTLPILLGIKTSKGISIIFLFCTLTTLALTIRSYIYFNFQMVSIIVITAIGILPLLTAVVKTLKGSEKKHYHQAGNMIKISMFGFLLFIYIHAITL